MTVASPTLTLSTTTVKPGTTMSGTAAGLPFRRDPALSPGQPHGHRTERQPGRSGDPGHDSGQRRWCHRDHGAVRHQRRRSHPPCGGLAGQRGGRGRHRGRRHTATGAGPDGDPDVREWRRRHLHLHRGRGHRDCRMSARRRCLRPVRPARRSTPAWPAAATPSRRAPWTRWATSARTVSYTWTVNLYHPDDQHRLPQLRWASTTTPASTPGAARRRPATSAA